MPKKKEGRGSHLALQTKEGRKGGRVDGGGKKKKGGSIRKRIGNFPRKKGGRGENSFC